MHTRVQAQQAHRTAAGSAPLRVVGTTREKELTSPTAGLRLMGQLSPTLADTILLQGRPDGQVRGQIMPQSESQASCSVVASTAEARLSSWPFSLSPGWTADRRSEEGPCAWAATPRAGTPPCQALHLRISSAMALWVRFSSFSSFLATSLLRSLQQGGGRRTEVEGWSGVALGAPCLQPLRHQESHSADEETAPGRKPGCSSSFLHPPNPAAILPSPSEAGTSPQTHPTQGPGSRCAMVDGFSGVSMGWPLSHCQGVTCPAHCGSCSSSSHCSLHHQNLQKCAHSRTSLALGFRGHRPHAFIPSNSNTFSGAVFDTDLQTRGRGPVPLAKVRPRPHGPLTPVLSPVTEVPGKAESPHFKEGTRPKGQQQLEGDWDRNLRLPFPPSFLHLAAP